MEITSFFYCRLPFPKMVIFGRPAHKREQADFQNFPPFTIFSTEFHFAPATPICPKYAINRPATGLSAGISAQTQPYEFFLSLLAASAETPYSRNLHMSGPLDKFKKICYNIQKKHFYFSIFLQSLPVALLLQRS